MRTSDAEVLSGKVGTFNLPDTTQESIPNKAVVTVFKVSGSDEYRVHLSHVTPYRGGDSQYECIREQIDTIRFAPNEKQASILGKKLINYLLARPLIKDYYNPPDPDEAKLCLFLSCVFFTVSSISFSRIQGYETNCETLTHGLFSSAFLYVAIILLRNRSIAAKEVSDACAEGLHLINEPIAVEEELEPSQTPKLTGYQ